MRIAFYMPLKPLGHPHPSGDLVIGTELFQFLQSQGHTLFPASPFRSRWVTRKPWLLPVLIREYARTMRTCRRLQPDIWLTYHTYYKAPDLLGPACCRRLSIPYVIFQGIYSTKQKRRLGTWAGFHANRWALLSASAVFSNKRIDYRNLQRIVPGSRLRYVTPGIHPEAFCFDETARVDLRKQWNWDDNPVILTAAMFRPGVKTKGLLEVIHACGILSGESLPVHLVIAGDGETRGLLRQAARKHLPDRVLFPGKIDRREMSRWCSAADIFAFPGYHESLGMVYLEAQSCGLPVVAYGNWGAQEVVQDGKTGLLARAETPDSFLDAFRQLLRDPGLRRKMGAAAARRVRERHNLDANYRTVEKELSTLGRRQLRS